MRISDWSSDVCSSDLLLLDETAKSRGVIASSAGNHAQGLVYHGRRLGIPVTIVMPRPTPIAKVSPTEGHGATVILEGETFEDAYAHAVEVGKTWGLTFVHPFDDADIIDGTVTIALEMLETAPEIARLVVPIGGGGLISDMATAAKALNTGIDVVGVEAGSDPAR